MGASHNFKITNDEELAAFYKQRHEGVVYIMEEFVNGGVLAPMMPLLIPRGIFFLKRGA